MESNNSTSSGGSSSHQALLTTVMELRNDLEKTMMKMQLLDEQNRVLSSNYQTIKDELLDTRRKYNEARENYMTTAAEKIESERQNDLFRENLRLQLAEKTKEFDHLREKFAPQDIDMIRIKVQEELEIPHRQRIIAMDVELQKHKDQYFAMRRELERSKAEYEAYAANQQREVMAIREENESVQTILREQITRLQERDAVMEKEETIRVKNVKLHELQHIVDLTRDEARALSDEKNAAIDALANYRLRHEETMEKLKDRCTLAEAAKGAAEERVTHLNTECDRKDVQVRAARQVADEATAQMDLWRRNLAAAEAQLVVVRSDHMREMEDLLAAHASERQALQEQVNAALEKMCDREELVRRAHRETAEIQARAESAEGDMRRAHNSNLVDVRKRLASVELELADTSGRLKLQEVNKQQQQNQQRAELDAARSEVSRLKREKDSLHDRVRELEHAAEAERRKAVQLRRELSSRRESGDVEVKEERAKASLAQRAVTQLQVREAELLAMVGEAERKRDDINSVLEALHAQAQNRMTTLATSYKAKVEDMKRSLHSALVKEKKRADTYKEKALQAHTRFKALGGGGGGGGRGDE